MLINSIILDKLIVFQNCDQANHNLINHHCLSLKRKTRIKSNGETKVEKREKRKEDRIASSLVDSGQIERPIVIAVTAFASSVIVPELSRIRHWGTLRDIEGLRRDLYEGRRSPIVPDAVASITISRHDLSNHANDPRNGLARSRRRLRSTRTEPRSPSRCVWWQRRVAQKEEQWQLTNVTFWELASSRPRSFLACVHLYSLCTCGPYITHVDALARTNGQWTGRETLLSRSVKLISLWSSASRTFRGSLVARAESRYTISGNRYRSRSKFASQGGPGISYLLIMYCTRGNTV